MAPKSRRQSGRIPQQAKPAWICTPLLPLLSLSKKNIVLPLKHGMRSRCLGHADESRQSWSQLTSSHFMALIFQAHWEFCETVFSNPALDSRDVPRANLQFTAAHLGSVRVGILRNIQAAVLYLNFSTPHGHRLGTTRRLATPNSTALRIQKRCTCDQSQP